MKKFQAETQINADPSTVWRILLDTGSWPEWDPFCERIEGEVAVGQKVKAFTTLSPGRGFPVKVAQLIPEQRMVWIGGAPFGLFKGVRSFELQAKADGVHFTLSEVFSGPLMFLIGKQLPDMDEAFQAFCQGLKERSEAS